MMEQDHHNQIKRTRLDATEGWVISLVIHMALLAVFGLLTWPVSHGSGGGEAEVAIYLGEENVALEAASGGLDSIATVPSLPLEVAQLPEPTIEISPIMDPAATETTAEPLAETIIANESPAPESSDSPAELWSGVLPGSGTTETGTASFFGLKARGSMFVYVVDYSGSMRGKKLEAAKAELIRSIRALKGNMHFSIIFYNNSFEPMPGESLVANTDQNQRYYFDWVGQVTAGGGTDPSGAMIKALSLHPHAIWLLSDGLFSDSACDVIRNANNGGQVQIHTIAFQEKHGENQLRRIARENRGGFRFVPVELISHRQLPPRRLPAAQRF